MKRILRILMIAICCMVSCNMVANAGNDKPISVNALPAKAQTLLSQHFNGQKVMLATIESGVVSRSYDVVLQTIPQPLSETDFPKFNACDIAFISRSSIHTQS